MHREGAWNSATERAARPVRGADRASPHWTTVNDGIVVVSLLALVGLVVGGLLTLLAWVTTTLPANPRIACPHQAACQAPAPDETQPALGHPRVQELTQTSR